MRLRLRHFEASNKTTWSLFANFNYHQNWRKLVEESKFKKILGISQTILRLIFYNLEVPLERSQATLGSMFPFICRRSLFSYILELLLGELMGAVWILQAPSSLNCGRARLGTGHGRRAAAKTFWRACFSNIWHQHFKPFQMVRERPRGYLSLQASVNTIAFLVFAALINTLALASN